MDHFATYPLLNGLTIPRVGFGTSQIPDGEPTAEAVCAAVAAGYRLIDTAARYDNETGVGMGVRRCGVNRSELFVTSKVWGTERGYDKTMASFEASMDRLGLDYLDLFLIHWPACESKYSDWMEQNLGSWKALKELYDAGRIKAVGVANFMPKYLQPLMDTGLVPMVNQIEFHPGYMQKECVDFCQANGIVVEAWSPLGRRRVLDHPLLNALADKYNKSVAQVCLRWCLQHNVLAIPKTVNPERLAQNLDLFDFELSADDMAQIDAMPEYGYSGIDPEVFC